MIVKRVRILVLTALLVGAATGMSGCPGDGDIVLFPDQGLEEAVRAELGIYFGFIRQGDMDQLRTLNARNVGITRLHGLEFATNLISLDVGNDALPEQGIADLTPVTLLRKLNLLNVENNAITNVAPLTGLLNLDQLYLAGNQIFHILPLVTNSDSGGLADGDTVTLSRAPLVDDSRTPPAISEDVGRLVANGVVVQLVE